MLNSVPGVVLSINSEARTPFLTLTDSSSCSNIFYFGVFSGSLYVCGEDEAGEAFAETFEVVTGEVCQEVVFLLHEHRKHFSNSILLLYGNVIESYCPVCYFLHMIKVV